MQKDDFGDRMKSYERAETGRRFMPLLPVYARIDGRGFSKFTRGMARPFDEDMVRCMQATTEWLVQETHAVAGYTQSDEISLLFYTDSTTSQIFFDGKIQKMVSVLAAMATAKFTAEAVQEWPLVVAKRVPVFDCRVFQLPNRIEAANAFLWREKDATKNAVSMAARDKFSHRALHGMSTGDMKRMLQTDHGIVFDRDYPAYFRHGTFYVRRREITTLSAEKLATIPEKHREEAARPKEQSVLRKVVLNRAFTSVRNRVEFLFEGAEPSYSIPQLDVIADWIKSVSDDYQVPQSMLVQLIAELQKLMRDESFDLIDATLWNFGPNIDPTVGLTLLRTTFAVRSRLATWEKFLHAFQNNLVARKYPDRQIEHMLSGML